MLSVSRKEVDHLCWHQQCVRDFKRLLSELVWITIKLAPNATLDVKNFVRVYLFVATQITGSSEDEQEGLLAPENVTLALRYGAEAIDG